MANNECMYVEDIPGSLVRSVLDYYREIRGFDLHHRL